jgi:hypothetical protein
MGKCYSRPVLRIDYKGKTTYVTQEEFSRIRTYGDLLDILKIYRYEWTHLEVNDGLVIEIVFAHSRFQIRELRVFTPMGDGRLIKMTALYR